MSIKENLISARALIDTPEKWAAMPVKAAIWYGASQSHNVASQMEDALQSVNGPRGTHPDVIALFDRAIANAH